MLCLINGKTIRTVKIKNQLSARSKRVAGAVNQLLLRLLVIPFGNQIADQIVTKNDGIIVVAPWLHKSVCILNMQIGKLFGFFQGKMQHGAAAVNAGYIVPCLRQRRTQPGASAADIQNAQRRIANQLLHAGDGVVFFLLMFVKIGFPVFQKIFLLLHQKVPPVVWEDGWFRILRVRSCICLFEFSFQTFFNAPF